LAWQYQSETKVGILKNHISEQNKLDYFKTRQSEAKWFYFKNLQEAKRFDNDFVFLKGKKELTFFSKPPVSPGHRRQICKQCHWNNVRLLRP
jgi:hypothetical protein